MKITFIIGGARSGKSSFALKEASGCEGQKAFIATAEAIDDEMKDRIDRHKVERGSDWSTYEEQINIADVLSELTGTYEVIVLDCITIWLSNLLIHAQMGADRQAVAEAVNEFTDRLQSLNSAVQSTGSGARIFIVSNEVGAGIVPENKLARQFRDLAGTLNQKVAGAADEVYLVTAGIPLKNKAQK